jgi:hypothetical protein
MWVLQGSNWGYGNVGSGLVGYLEAGVSLMNQSGDQVMT